MPRKATGQLIWYASGWHARYPATVDGERKTVFVDLETKNELLAKRKLAALIAAENEGRAPSDVETFERAAERVYAMRLQTYSGAKIQLGFLRKHAHPIIGRIPVNEIRKADVISVLEAVRDARLSDGTITHVRNAIAAVFRQLQREHVVEHAPMPSGAEVPECFAEVIDDRPKAVLSDDELLVYLAYTDPREGEKYRGAVRERQLMALLSRCVGGMRTGELHGLTWARARVEGEAFDALEVVRYKTRRKAMRRGSKAAVRQLYPLGDTVLPYFLRYWWLRSRRPDGDALLFPVRRPKRLAATDQGDVTSRVGERRLKTTHALPMRRDLQRAFEAAIAQGRADVPAPGSRRWAELFDGTNDRRPLWFHNSRNAAAVMAERFERLRAAAKFTGHASGRMLQHYREMAGEVDVVPVAPELMPDSQTLLEILRAWCETDGMDPDDIFGSPPDGPNDEDENAYGKRIRRESPQITTRHSETNEAKTGVISRFAGDRGASQSWRTTRLCYTPKRAERSARTEETQGTDGRSREPDRGDKRILNTHAPQITTEQGSSEVSALPAGDLSVGDLLQAADEAVIAGDLPRARRLIAEAAGRVGEVAAPGRKTRG